MVDRLVQTLTANSDPLAANAEPSVQRVANMIDMIFHGTSKERAVRQSDYYKTHVHVDVNMEKPARNYANFVPARTKKSSTV